MQNLPINISPTDRPQWHTPAEIRAAAEFLRAQLPPRTP